MPYTIKTQQIAVKDPDTGVYSGVDVLAEQTKEGLLTEIGNLADTKETEITTLGNAKKQAITDEASSQITAITTLGDAKKQAITDEASSQITAITTLGDAKKQAITDEGALQVQNVNSKGEEVLASIPQDYTNLSYLINKTVKAGFVYKTTAGNIVNFDDGSDGMLIKNLVAAFEPKQDFNGYDHPWPALGRKNLFKFPDNNRATNNGVIYTRTDDTLECAGTATANSAPYQLSTHNTYNTALSGPLEAGTYTISVSGFPAATGYSNSYVRFYAYDENDNQLSDALVIDATGTGTGSVTVTLSTAVKYTMYIQFNHDSNVDATIRIQIEKGSTATEWEPYQNYSSISGAAGITLHHHQKNFFNVEPYTVTKSGVIFTRNTDGSITLETTSGVPSTENVVFPLIGSSPNNSYIIDIPKGNYYLSGGYSNSIYITMSDGDTNGTRYNSTRSDADTLVTCTTGKLYYPRVVIVGNPAFDSVTIYPMLRMATDSSNEFEKHNGEIQTILFGNEPGTVYGAELNTVTGLLTVNYRLFTFGTGKQYTFNSNSSKPYTNAYVYGFASIGELIEPNKASDVTKAVCTHLPSISRNAAPLSSTKCGIFQVHNDGYNTVRLAFPLEDCFSTETKVTEWIDAQNEAETPFEVAIPLKNPVEYQLTPQQISTFLGENIIWGENEETFSVTYPVDTKTYIDKKIQEVINAASGS